VINVFNEHNVPYIVVHPDSCEAPFAPPRRFAVLISDSLKRWHCCSAVRVSAAPFEAMPFYPNFPDTPEGRVGSDWVFNHSDRLFKYPGMLYANFLG